MERLTMNNGLCKMASTEFCISQKDCYSCPHGRKCFKLLAAYEDTGLEPEEVTELMAAHGTAILALSEYRSIGPAKHFLELTQAEKDGRLVVLPCKTGDELASKGLTFKADHWNVILTAFADDASAPFGKRVKLFSPEEAEAALKKEGGGRQ